MILCKPQKVFTPASLSRDSVTYGAITACRLCHARLKERADLFSLEGHITGSLLRGIERSANRIFSTGRRRRPAGRPFSPVPRSPACPVPGAPERRAAPPPLVCRPERVRGAQRRAGGLFVVNSVGTAERKGPKPSPVGPAALRPWVPVRGVVVGQILHTGLRDFRDRRAGLPRGHERRGVAA